MVVLKVRSERILRLIYLSGALMSIIWGLSISGCSPWMYYQEGKTELDVQQDQTECENRIQTVPEQGRKVRVLPTDRQITECMKEKGYQYVTTPQAQ